MPGATEPTPSDDAVGGDAIVARNLLKRYPRFRSRRDRVAALIGFEDRLDATIALDDVSFTVPAGEAFGVIGENGSGKSTLLKVVAGISDPDRGDFAVQTPVSAILELGLGFHPEFTGRQNALMYGSLLGVPQEAMDRRLDEILDFAELGEFIDQPLRTYSTGMVARLAFAVATNVDPAVLVVDEALAVGDGAFQKKCVDRMISLKRSGCTILFCSHAMYLVTSFCERALWLRGGRVEALGPAGEVVQQYETYLMRRRKAPERTDAPQVGGGAAAAAARLADVDVRSLGERSVEALAPGDGIEVDLVVETLEPVAEYHVGVAIDGGDGRCVFAAGTHWDRAGRLHGQARYEVTLRVPTLPLAGGSYSLTAFLLDDEGLVAFDQVVLPVAFTVAGRPWTPMLVELDHQWHCTEA